MVTAPLELTDEFLGAIDAIQSTKNGRDQGGGRTAFPLRGRPKCLTIETGLDVILLQLQATIPLLRNYRLCASLKSPVLLIAKSGAIQQFIHRDLEGNDGLEAQYLSCLIALQATNETNGLTTLFHTQGDGSKAPPYRTAKVSVALEILGALVFAAETWHYGGANRSLQTRRMLHFYLEHVRAHPLKVY
jgi:hypothetical protein